MAAAPPASALDTARQALSEQRWDDARRELLGLLQRHGPAPAVLHLMALTEQGAGQIARAEALFDAAIKAAPTDAAPLANRANLRADQGRLIEALDDYDRALTLKPGLGAAALNRAATLAELGRHDEARAAFAQLEPREASNTAFWRIRADTARLAGDARAERSALDRLLALNPDDAAATERRATIALLTAEGDAPQRIRAARQRFPANGALLLAAVDAAVEEGAFSQAEALLADALGQAPDWLAGRERLAMLYWEAGDEPAFRRAIGGPATRHADNPALALSAARLLAGVDRHAEAADRCAAARQRQEHPTLALAEAIHAGQAGDATRAEAIFATLTLDSAERWRAEARHRIRQGAIDAAGALLEKALERQPDDLASWALRGVVWRLLGDPRAGWLNGEPALFGTVDLGLEPDALDELVVALRDLHRAERYPIGQSLRQGTQTRGRLLDRDTEPWVSLRAVIAEGIERFRAVLPPADATHPLLRHRDAPWRFEGSWSVRLTKGGYHKPHLHPEGWLSSACHLLVPTPGESDDSQPGWLEIGRPPPDLNVALEPLASIKPQPGKLVLFPSYLYHGTRPFAAGERISVAFDAALALRR